MKKTLTKSEARFFAQVVPPDYLLIIFLILTAQIDVSEDPNDENMFLDGFVPVWHPLHVTLQIFYLFFFNLVAILEICKLDSEDANIVSLPTLVFGFSIPEYP